MDRQPQDIVEQARALVAEGRSQEARDLLVSALSEQSHDDDLWHELGVVHAALGANEAALAAFSTSLRLATRRGDTLRERGRVLFALQRVPEAIESFRDSLEIESDVAKTHLLLARALARDIRPREAEQALRRAVELDPNDPESHLLLGYQLQEFGEFEPAIECFERAIALRPAWGAPYLGIASSRVIMSGDPLIGRVEGLLDGRSLALPDSRDLRYALGKVHNDLGNYGEAIAEFEVGHGIAARCMNTSQRPFDREGYAQHVELMERFFTRELFERCAALGSEDQTPILIVGMPRSGSTLLEQMLSAHPEIGAAGELLFWRGKGGALFQQLRAGAVSRESVEQMGAEYLTLLSRLGGGRPRVTDKMPNNYLYLGAFHIAFPKAKIVVCQRHPVDNCLSLFMTPSKNPGPMVHNMETLAQVYEGYVRLVDHWRQTLSPEIFREVSYEAMIADPETEMRALVDWLGLEWREDVLHPDRNTRTVSTPSVWQVRQPLYKTSVERWRRYEPWLGPLRRLLPK